MNSDCCQDLCYLIAKIAKKSQNLLENHLVWECIDLLIFIIVSLQRKNEEGSTSCTSIKKIKVTVEDYDVS